MSAHKIPEILFATVAVGGGHVATAKAMSEAIDEYFPGRFRTRVSDYVGEIGAEWPAVERLDRSHKSSWRFALKYPVLARAGQHVIDTFPGTTISGQRRLVSGFARAAAARLNEERPLLVVSNHGLLTTGLAVAKKRYGLDVPVLTYATEPYRISAYWADPQADHIAVPNEQVRLDLLKMKVSKERLSVTGYPVRRSFLFAPAKVEARRALGLDDRFTCLVSLGGEGVGGRPEKVVRALLASDFRPNVVVVCGRNKRLLRELSRKKAPGRASGLRIEGFVEEVAPYVAASDVVVGKSGPASVHEALAVGRPVVLTGYAGLNERGVARFVEKAGLGRLVRTPDALVEAVGRYAAEPSLLKEAARKSKDLDLAAQTEGLARYVVDYALHGGSSACGGSA